MGIGWQRSIATLNGNVATGVLRDCAHHGFGFGHQQRARVADRSAATAGVNSVVVNPPPFNFYWRHAATHRCRIRPERESDERPRIRVGKYQPKCRCRGRQDSRAALGAGTSQISASAQGIHSNADQPDRQPAAFGFNFDSMLSPSTASIQAGNTQQFAAVGYDQYDNVNDRGVVFTWFSSSPNVASVSGVNAEGQNVGVATGLAAGSTQITVSAGGVNTTVSLTVTPPPPPPPPPAVTTINVMPGNVSINMGGTQQFSALATDQHGPAMSGVVFSWTSSDPAVASIDANGLLPAWTRYGTDQRIGPRRNQQRRSSDDYAPVHRLPLTITRLSPPMALVGSGDLISLTITGTGFVPERW